MGVVVPNFASSTEDRASGALVIDGSLRFDDDKTQYLRKAFASEGNRKTFTWSCWLKVASFGDWRRIFTCEPANADIAGLAFRGDGNIDGIRVQQQDSGANNHFTTSAVYRDPNAWYHLVMAVDTTLATASDRIKVYVNGELQSGSYTTGAEPTQNSTWFYNSTSNYHEIGRSTTYAAPFDGHMTQCYWIDGQQLGPEYFGYTDPLTNTWRPKKFIKQASPNDGTTWSSYLTADSGSITNAANAFNNDVLSFNTSTVNEAVFTFTPPTPIQYKNSVRIWLRTALHKARINGGTYIFNTGAQLVGQWMTLATGSGSIQSIDVQYTGGSQTAINAIEVDGVILVDGLNDNGGVGTNGFYLPMDGNSPVGQDQSGRGNDWQPINFGGSVELPKATGAIPILNTNEAGNVGKPGFRTDKKTYTVTASGSSYYLLDGVQQPTLSALRGGSYTFDYTGATSHPFYLSSLQDGKHNSEAYSVTFDGEDSWIDVANGVTIGTSTFTWECFFYVDNFKDFCTIFDTRESSSSDANGIYVGARVDGLVYVWSNGYRIQTNRVSTGEWHHLALVRDSNNLMHLYIDGTHAYNTSGAWTFSNSVNALTRIGQTQYSSFVTGSDFEWEGKLSNVRITVGQALYTSNFTPPTTTLTTTSQGAIASNVKLLCCQSSSATTAAVSPGTLTTSGASTAAVNVSPFLYDNNHGFFGVNTATSNTTKITIPHWAPDTLYYYCNVHSGMGGRIDVTTDNLRADPYAWMCRLALPLTGRDNRDLSSDINVNATAMTVSPTASVTGSSVKYNFYGSSTYYGDHTNAHRHGISANNGLSFGDVPWTIECWCYRDSASVSNTYQTLWSFRTNGTADYYQAGWISFLISASSGLLWYYGTGSANTNFSPTETIGLNRWTHIASVWDGKGNIELYFDGIKVKTQAISKTDWGSSTLPFYIADQAFDGGVRPLSGYMQDFRVYKGVAKYSENFVPAATDPDILPDTPSGVSGGSKLTKVTDGAVAFDGTGDYLTFTSGSDLQFGSGDFTIECYVYPNTLSNYDPIIDNGSIAGNNQHDWRLYLGGAGEVWFDIEHSNGSYFNGSGASAGVNYGVVAKKWNHIAITRSGNTVYTFVDGIQKGSTSFSGTIDSDYTTAYIGADNMVNGTMYYFNGFISNVRVVKGTALYTSNFTPPSAPLTNVTNTKLLCCQSNTSAGAAAVTPGSITANGNAAATNFNPFTTDINAVRGQESGYCTLNPLNTDNISTFSDGNLSTVCATGVGQGCSSGGNIAVSSGKWYCEMVCTAKTATNALIGVCTIDGFDGQRQIDESQNGGSGYGYVMNGTRVPGGTSYGATWAIGDVMGIALDLDSSQNTVTFYKNGVSQGPINITNAKYVFGCSNGQGSSSVTYSTNFGQKPFKFPPPDGFQPLNASTVRPSTVIVRPDKYFGTLLYTADVSAGKTVTGLNFGDIPDFVWIKNRDNVESHHLMDTVRGNSSFLFTNHTNVESSTPYNDGSGTLSFDFVRDGVSFADSNYNSGELYFNNRSYIAYCWKAGGNSNTFNVNGRGYATASDAGLTGGTIALTGASVNTDAGFSILTFTGTGNAGSIPHGLTQAPDLLIGKNRDRTTDWKIYLPDTGNYAEFTLLAQSSVTNAYTGVTSSLINLQGTGYALNYSTDSRSVIYCWHNVEGLQKFGSYVANNSNDGPYIHLGFRPAMVIVRSINGATARDWLLWDSARNTYNGQQTGALCPNGDFTESARSGTIYNAIDFLSDGFKLRTNGTPNMNASSETYIYMAWAEAPSFNLFGAQSNAR